MIRRWSNTWLKSLYGNGGWFLVSRGNGNCDFGNNTYSQSDVAWWGGGQQLTLGAATDNWRLLISLTTNKHFYSTRVCTVSHLSYVLGVRTWTKCYQVLNEDMSGILSLNSFDLKQRRFLQSLMCYRNFDYANSCT